MQVTYAVSRIHAAWLGQTRPGGVIVAPWRTGFVNRGAVVRLTVDEQGNASGPFTRPAEFMRDRRDRHDVDHHAYIPADAPGWPADTTTSTTHLTRDDLHDPAAELVIGMRVPDVVAAPAHQGDLPVTWLYSRTSPSWAAIIWHPDAPTQVLQGGPHPLWPPIEQTCDHWHASGRPPLTSLTLTITPTTTTLQITPTQPRI